MNMEDSDGDFNVTVGEYINIFDQNGGNDIYITLNESNSPVTPDEVETIFQTVASCRTISDIYRSLNALDLDCLECGFIVLER